MNIQKLIPLANFTTWKVGGEAELFAEPKSINELVEVILWAKEAGIPCNTIGAGSNLLINDVGLPGLTICTRKMQGIDINNKNVSCYSKFV